MLSYILFNTLIYGSLARCMSVWYRYGKFLNIALWSSMIFGTYTFLYLRENHSVRRVYILIFGGLLGVFILINHITIAYFPHASQRDLFGLIFTLGGSLVIENVCYLIYWPNAISSDMRPTPWIWWLVLFILLIFVISTYVFHISYRGKIRQAIESQTNTVRTLGINITSLLHKLFVCLFPFIIILWIFIANNSSLKPSDNLFYFIKAIGIMIMVGIENKYYLYIGALIYVSIEYLLFISRWLPISYKEGLILFLILMVLLVKPQGLFHLFSRTV